MIITWYNYNDNIQFNTLAKLSVLYFIFTFYVYSQYIFKIIILDNDLIIYFDLIQQTYYSMIKLLSNS